MENAMKIFLSFAFSHGQELTRPVERLLASHDVEIVTGRRLGGAMVDEGIKKKILDADGLISLLTKREKIEGGAWTTSQAVLEELSFAHDQRFTGQQKRAIALIEDGVRFQSMGNYEYIPYEPDKPLEAILALSETLAKWRQEIGQELKVQILPNALAEKLGSSDQPVCSHRFLEKDISTPWKEVPAIAEEEGTFIYLRGVRAGHRIQLRIKDQNLTWQSAAKSPWAVIQLRENQNG
jgi:hypothetical protein